LCVLPKALTLKGACAAPAHPETTEPAVATPVEEVTTMLKTRLLRGSISNSGVESSTHLLSLPFIHTTDLVAGRLHSPKKRIFKSDVVFATGPAVLIPRVCKPDINKVVLLPVGMTAVLSDCIMGIECLTLCDAEKLRNQMTENWSEAEMIYVGTCARYVSVDGLKAFLEKSGCELVSCLKELRNTSAIAIEEQEAVLT
jgi:hypothetical protein